MTRRTTSRPTDAPRTQDDYLTALRDIGEVSARWLRACADAGIAYPPRATRRARPGRRR